MNVPSSDSSQGLQIRLKLQRQDFLLDAYLTLPDRGVTAVFGHSGSGKTSLLRCIAGLETGKTACVRFRGQVWEDSETGLRLPPHRRPLACVFQDACLFPHLDVRANLDYGRRRRPSKRPPDEAAILDLLGIGHLLGRSTATLSGGERQRVAIARALLSGPELLLMDEPLASLDHARKEEILPYLERLHSHLSCPILYITHSAEEVLRLADHLVILDHGRVQASGTLQDTLSSLSLPEPLHRDFGVPIEAVARSHDPAYGLLEAEFSGGRLSLPHAPIPAGMPLRLRIHSRDVSISLETPVHSSVLNLIHCTVCDELRQDGEAHVLVRLDAGGTPLLARITRLSYDRLQLRAGLQVCAQIKAVALAG